MENSIAFHLIMVSWLSAHFFLCRTISYLVYDRSWLFVWVTHSLIRGQKRDIQPRLKKDPANRRYNCAILFLSLSFKRYELNRGKIAVVEKDKEFPMVKQHKFFFGHVSRANNMGYLVQHWLPSVPNNGW